MHIKIQKMKKCTNKNGVNLCLTPVVNDERMLVVGEDTVLSLLADALQITSDIKLKHTFIWTWRWVISAAYDA